MVKDGRPQRCASCGPLGEEADWGEHVGGPDVPAPAAFERLRHAASLAYGRALYRCPACGSYFELTKHEETFYGSSTWDSYTLRRCGPGAPAPVVQEAVRTGDFRRLAGALLDTPNEAARLGLLEV